jgi:hypothetical protein
MAQPGRTAQSNGRHTGCGELDVLAEPPHELDQRACLCTRAFSQPLNPSPTNPIPFRACADMALVPFGSTGTGPTDRLCRKAMQKVPGGTDWGVSKY